MKFLKNIERESGKLLLEVNPLKKGNHSTLPVNLGIFGIPVLGNFSFTEANMLQISIAAVLLLVLFWGIRYIKFKAKKNNSATYKLNGELNSKKHIGKRRSIQSQQIKEKILKELWVLMEEKRIYRQKGITLEKLARMQGTNRTYLSTAIHEEYNQNFTCYINKYRIKEAIGLLSDHDNKLPIKAISEHLGFQSLSTFYNAFNKIVETSPSQYRRRSIAQKQKEVETFAATEN